MDVFIGRRKEEPKDKLKDRARIRLHPITKIPDRVANINIYPKMLRDGELPVTKTNAAEVFRGFITDHKEFFGVEPEDLKLESMKQVRGRWYAKYRQEYKGIPVLKATVGLDASDKGQVQTYASTYQPKIEVQTEPQVPLEAAAKTAIMSYREGDRSKLHMKESKLIIYTSTKEDKSTYHLAWRLMIVGDEPDPEIEKWFTVDAVDGKILESYTARFPDAKIHGTVRGEIYPENPTDAVVTRAFKSEYVTVHNLGDDTTDASGQYEKTVPWYWPFLEMFSSPDARFRLRGPYAQVQDRNGNNYNASHNCSTGSPCNHTWTATDRDHINVFYHMNLFHDWLKSQLNYSWVNPWDGTARFNARVNYTFNNAYAGDPMQFGTSNYARSSDIIYHECTHNVLYKLYGDYIGWPNNYTEAYAMDEGFADYFACSFTEHSVMGEGAGGGRDLDNNDSYTGKDTFNLEGHTGGKIIAGAAWNLRQRLIAALGAPGHKDADELIFDAHQILSTYPRDYYFSDPQESNLLSAIYMADDNNSNLVDGVPNFWKIHDSFAEHDLLQAVLLERDSFDFTANMLGTLTGGDLYYYDGKFWANNVGQRGVKDIGATAVDLDDVVVTFGGYTRFGVEAVVGHTYISLAHDGEVGNAIVFRVKSISGDKSRVVVEYRYRRMLFVIFPERVHEIKEFFWEEAHAEFSYKDRMFSAKGEDLEGMLDLGEIDDRRLKLARVPRDGYVKEDVPVKPGHVYVVAGGRDRRVVFRVKSVSDDKVEIELLEK